MLASSSRRCANIEQKPRQPQHNKAQLANTFTRSHDHVGLFGSYFAHRRPRCDPRADGTTYSVTQQARRGACSILSGSDRPEEESPSPKIRVACLKGQLRTEECAVNELCGGFDTHVEDVAEQVGDQAPRSKLVRPMQLKVST